MVPTNQTYYTQDKHKKPNQHYKTKLSLLRLPHYKTELEEIRPVKQNALYITLNTNAHTSDGKIDSNQFAPLNRLVNFRFG